MAFPVNPSQALTHQQHLQRLWYSNYARYVRLLHTAVRRPFLRTISSPRVAEATSSPCPNRAPCSPPRTRAGSPRSTYTPCHCPGTAATRPYSLEYSYQHILPTNNTPPPRHHRLRPIQRGAGVRQHPALGRLRALLAPAYSEAGASRGFDTSLRLLATLRRIAQSSYAPRPIRGIGPELSFRSSVPQLSQAPTKPTKSRSTKFRLMVADAPAKECLAHVQPDLPPRHPSHAPGRQPVVRLPLDVR